MAITFSALWNLHHDWARGIIFNKKLEIDSATLYFSDVIGPYYSYAALQTHSPTHRLLQNIEKEFAKRHKQPSFSLHEGHQKHHIPELLVRNYYSFMGNDTWMVLSDQANAKTSQHDIHIITPETFKDFESVLTVVFSDFSGNQAYLEICKKSIEKTTTDVTSELYVINDEGKPAAGAGLFYSKEANFAYLHNAGTLEAYRKKGYQTDLINHRLQRAQSHGISQIYSIVSRGSASWANMIRCGFEEAQNMTIFVKKE